MAYVLRTGDTVIWRGNFGSAPPVEATVSAIELVEEGSKYGEELVRVVTTSSRPSRQVGSTSWSNIVGRRAVVTLNIGNGQEWWAYGNQVSPKGTQA
jgi:hypothetical protein